MLLLVAGLAATACSSAPDESQPRTTAGASGRDDVLRIDILAENAANPRTRRMRWLVGDVEVQSIEALKAQLETVRESSRSGSLRSSPTVDIWPHPGIYYREFEAVALLAEELGFTILVAGSR
jgi:hypothetical protein